MMNPDKRAREALADAIEAQGDAWKNSASLVRGGFSNIWIAPALVALSAVIAQLPEGEE